MSRNELARQLIEENNNTGFISKIINAAFDSRHFIGFDSDIQRSVDAINVYLKYDGIEVKRNGRAYSAEQVKQQDLEDGVDIEMLLASDDLAAKFALIQKYMEKTRERIRRGDHDGAVTSARTMLEGCLIGIGGELEADIDLANLDGDLKKLYKAVAKALNIQNGPTNPIANGLSAIIAGMAQSRNELGDAHAQALEVKDFEAYLIVNAAITVMNYLLGVYDDQLRPNKNRLKVVGTIGLKKSS